MNGKLTTPRLVPEPTVDRPAKKLIVNMEFLEEEGNEITLKDLQGKTIVYIINYTSCKAVYPKLVADMRGIENNIPKQLVQDPNFIMESKLQV